MTVDTSGFPVDALISVVSGILGWLIRHWFGQDK